MDPLGSVKEFREQQSGSGRVIKIAPPPIVPVAVSVAAADAAEVDETDETGETGELELADLATEPEAEGAGEGAPELRRGFPRGRKQVLQVNIPVPARVHLEQAREEHGTLGKAAMAALRGSYQWLVDNFTPEPAEAVGPFPAPRPTRRRLAIEDPRIRQLLLDPGEVAGIETLADQLEMSLSELVTLALDHWYGEKDSTVTTSPRSRVKAKA